MRTFKMRQLALMMLVLILAAATYGFAAANTVPNGNAGDGSGTISGYTISNVDYTLLSSDPSKISQVDFTITPDNSGSNAATVKISLNGSSWVDCTVSGTSASCSFASGSEPTVQGANALRVVATE